MNQSSEANSVSIVSVDNGASMPVTNYITIQTLLKNGTVSIQYLKYQKEQDQPFQCIICNTTFRLLQTFVMHMTQRHNKYMTVDQLDQVEKQLLALLHKPSTSLKVVKSIKSSESKYLQTSKEAKSDEPTCNFKATDVNCIKSADSEWFPMSGGAQSCTPEVLHYMKPPKAQKNFVLADPVHSLHIENSIITTTELELEEDMGHPKDEPVRCSFCLTEFSSNYVLKSHIKSQHPLAVECDVCQNFFATVLHLERHICVHTQKLKNSIQCKKKFMYEGNLKKHLETHSNQTTSVKLLNCPQCIQQFRDKPALDMHKTEVHNVSKNEDGPSSCTYGDKTIKTSVYKIIAPSSAAFPPKICRVDETLVNTTGDPHKTNSTTATDTENSCIDLVTDAEFSEKDCLHEFERNFVDKKSCPAVSEAIQYHKYKKEQDESYQCIRCNTTFRLLKTFVMHMAHVHNTYIVVDHMDSLEKELEGSKDKAIKTTESEYFTGGTTIQLPTVGKKKCFGKAYFKHRVKNVLSLTKDEDALLLACETTSDIQKEKTKCHICRRSFKTKRSLRMHISFIHPKDKPVKCSLCVKQFWENSDLDKHIRKVHSEVNHEHDLLSCKYCNKKFRTKYDQNKHIRVVHGVKLCSICGKLCKGTKNLYYHIRYEHRKGRCSNAEYEHAVEEEKYKCQLCLRRFGNNVVLRIHEKKHLGENGCFKCLMCCFTVAKKEHLVAHVKCEHSDIINLGRIAYNQKQIKQKSKKHIKCQCHHCGVILNNENILSRHLQSQHPSDETSSFTCNECSKSYQNKHSLQMHIYTVHTPRNYCVCHVCGRQFTCKGMFMKHMLIHTGPQHECGLCYKKFRTSYYLKVHQRMHSGVKQLLCPICSKQCAFATGLKYHIKTHHKMS